MKGGVGCCLSRLDFPLSPLLCFMPTVKGTAFSTICFHHDLKKDAPFKKDAVGILLMLKILKDWESKE